MSVVLQLIAVAISLFIVYRVLGTMKKRKLSEAQSILWLIAALCLLILSVFPRLVNWGASLLGIWWAPAIIIFAMLIVMGLMLFHHAEDLSKLHAETAELSMQLGLLKHELEMRNAEAIQSEAAQGETKTRKGISEDTPGQENK